MSAPSFPGSAEKAVAYRIQGVHYFGAKRYGGTQQCNKPEKQ